MYHTQRELLRERTRCKALEEELENPMNIHRWRKLEVLWQILTSSFKTGKLLLSIYLFFLGKWSKYVRNDPKDSNSTKTTYTKDWRGLCDVLFLCFARTRTSKFSDVIIRRRKTAQTQLEIVASKTVPRNIWASRVILTSFLPEQKLQFYYAFTKGAFSVFFISTLLKGIYNWQHSWQTRQSPWSISFEKQIVSKAL